MKQILRYLINSLMVVFVISCGGGGGGTVLTTITSFETSDTTITKGSSVNLTAVFQNGTASINNNVGAVSSNVAKSVTPTSTTTYILKVTNSLGASITSSVTVTVIPVYNIFPPNFFDGTYNTGTVIFNGSDTDDATHTAELLEVSGTETMFNGLTVKTIDETLSITNEMANSTSGELSQQYWTTGLNNIKYVGYEIPPGTGTYAKATSNSIMPVTTYIGNSGTMGSYIRDDGSTFIITWQLVADTSPNAKYITTTVSKDNLDKLDYTATVTNFINQAGIISKQTIVIIYHEQPDRTLTLTGP